MDRVPPSQPKHKSKSGDKAYTHIKDRSSSPLTSSSIGFGSSGTNAFGAPKPAFGAAATTSGGSLFGGGTATAGSAFGGFGQTAAAPSTGFGASANTGGGLFGSKPAFGANTTTSTGFGASNTNSSPFGGGGGAFGSATAPSTALGGPVGDCQGTGVVPFTPYVEKEPNSSSNQQNSFQSIGFQQPYQKFSPEELRLADYTQGRRYGNQSNQPGAFGANTNFGSFGSNTQSTNTGFGATNSGSGSSLFGGGGGGTSTGFGATSQPNTGFGANTSTSGGLFGAKPATGGGGLFGSQTQTQPSGGLFGNNGSTGFGSNTSGGFGTPNNTATGSSLFGSNNTAAKPAFSFGTTPASSSTGFGTTPAATNSFGAGGLFGSPNTNTTSPFGGQQQQQQPAATNTFGGFGNAQQQTSSLFGNNQQKPATSLFGQQSAAPSGGLFGGTQPAASTTTNPFGTSTNTQGSGGLFGQKPATAGTSLFGAPQNTQTSNTGGSLFGSGFGTQNQTQNQPQQNTGGSLFGLGNNNQQKTSLFGNPQPQQQQLGGSLFGSTGTQQPGGGLFGSTTQQPQQQQQQPQNSLFGANSLFGGSPQNQNQPQQGLTTSIKDPNAFGTSIFSQLGAGQNIPNPGPLVTPLSGSKPKKSAALPIYKLNPASSSRFSTPVKRGFGFSYSNYGSPGSASSTASTPGGNLNGSLLGGSFGRGLSKSVSTSSLRRSFATEDSILAPGAFSASPSARHYGSTGSMKKLVINRSLRGDLFSPPAKATQQQIPSTPTNGIMKKRVSWSNNTTNDGANGSNGANGATSPLKEIQNNSSPSPEDLGFLRPKPGAKATSNSGVPEMEQVRNNELAIVHEEEAITPSRFKGSLQASVSRGSRTRSVLDATQ